MTANQERGPFYKAILPHLLPLLDPLPEEPTMTEPTILRRVECARGHIHYALEQLRMAHRDAKTSTLNPITRTLVKNSVGPTTRLWNRLRTLTNHLEREEQEA